jgi:SPP1 family predicted phage head-tail adaptor
MKCCDIHSGMLNAQITIQRKARWIDSMGGSNDIWADEATIWAHWKGLSGGERWQAMRVSPHNRFRAIIRFKGDENDAPYYTAEDRVSYRGRIYAVESVIDMEDRQEWLELTLLEGGKS